MMKPGNGQGAGKVNRYCGGYRTGVRLILWLASPFNQGTDQSLRRLYIYSLYFRAAFGTEQYRLQQYQQDSNAHYGLTD